MKKNGVVSAAHVDYERHCFVARDGTELELQPIPKMVLERLYNDNAGKPKPPIVEVKIAGQFARMEANPDDPDYKTALENWEGAKNLRIARYVIGYGIKTNPPETFVDEFSEFFPNANEKEMRYIWVAQLLGEIDATDWRLLTEAITSQTAITETGVEQATDSFPGDGERVASGTISTGTPASSDSVQSGV